MGFMTWDKGRTKRAGLFSSALYRLTQMSEDTKEKAVASLIQYSKARSLLGEGLALGSAFCLPWP